MGDDNVRKMVGNIITSHKEIKKDIEQLKTEEKAKNKNNVDVKLALENIASLLKENKKPEEEGLKWSKDSEELLQKVIMEINELKGVIIPKDIKDLSSEIASINIPTEIKVIKQNQITFADLTRKFLLVYFLLSVFFVGGATWWTTKSFSEIREDKEKLTKDKAKFQKQIETEWTREEIKWLQNYHDFMKVKDPRNDLKFNKTQPFPLYENK